MNEDLTEYFQNYLAMPGLLIFILINVAIMAVIYYIFYRLSVKRTGGKKKAVVKDFILLSERFYEVIFSATSIIGFMAIYYFIDRFVDAEPFRSFWNQYNDFILLFMMIISIIFNTILDHLIVRLKSLSVEDMASARLIGMLYMIIIFGYIKFVYEDDNYDMFITYFLTLMIGRFVYFDASFKDFVKNIKRAALNIPLMLLALIYCSILAFYGFKSGFMQTHIGVIVNIFVAHLFICVIIAILCHIAPLVIKKLPDDKTKPKD